MKVNVSGIIDRFEGEYAVLLLGNEQEDRLDMLRKFLPEGTKEGDRIELSIKTKPDKDREAREKVKGMIKEVNSRQ